MLPSTVVKSRAERFWRAASTRQMNTTEIDEVIVDVDDEGRPP